MGVHLAARTQAVKMAVLFGLLYMYLVAVSASPICDFEQTHQHALYAHNTWIHRDFSLDQCRVACLEKEECLSFDYNFDRDSCFLSDQTKTTAPDSFGRHMKMDYFEKVCDPYPLLNLDRTIHLENNHKHCH